ncbi:DNA-binding HxlR family transcriptional regulator [Okibacterium sp. HSC-33S16]|uniref:winged helix-turn-helix transcriptional regulator n=1 Tax=Okibacterium sp. HSC-33S16 TaxID=2910965 RepID=UPI0020A13F73|nr:helix-turn-helix domain-containing protein [Okibacterium sp. HSC-33S16]MCP2032964.1 DNA-binding HxlR family transcriptional regulator [Okibacterium sp. HSC-33S16]
MRGTSFEHINDDECRQFQAAVELAGRKWNAAILLAGARGARRFSEYRDSVDGISDRLLAARLRELEADGLIGRDVTPTTPVTISYTPTDDGRRLIALMRPLVLWSRERADRAPKAQSA